MRLILEVHPTHPSLSPTHICRPLAAIAGMGSIAGGHLQNLGVAAMQSAIPGKKIKQKANASGHLAPSKAHMATLRGRSKTIGQATVSSTHKAFPKLQGPCEDQKQFMQNAHDKISPALLFLTEHAILKPKAAIPPLDTKSLGILTSAGDPATPGQVRHARPNTKWIFCMSPWDKLQNLVSSPTFHCMWTHQHAFMCIENDTSN